MSKKDAMELLKKYDIINNPLRAMIKKQIDLDAMHLHQKAVHFKIDKEVMEMCTKLKRDESEEDPIIQEQKLLNEENLIFLKILFSKYKI